MTIRVMIVTELEGEKMKPSDFIKKGWCREELARDKDGDVTYFDAQQAVAWCAMGAIFACRDVSSHDALKALRSYVGNNVIALWNDDPNRTQQEIIDAFEAIGL